MRNGHLGRIKRLEKLARPCRACAIRESRGYEVEWLDLDEEDESEAAGGFECEECGAWIEDLIVTWPENLPRPEPRPWARFE